MLLSFSITMLLTRLVTSLISFGISDTFFFDSKSSGTTGQLTGFETLGTFEYWSKGQERIFDLRADTKSRPSVDFEEVSEEL